MNASQTNFTKGPRFGSTFTVTAWMAKSGSVLTEALVNGPVQGPIQVRTIRETDARLVFEIALGTRRFLVKAFDPNHPNSQKSVMREITCLTSLRASALVPEIELASPERRFLVMTFIDGPRLLDGIEPSTLDTVSVELGAWFARYAQLMPARPTRTTWFDYLSKYGALAETDAIEEARDFLSSAEVGQLMIAKNDAFLGNFLRARSGDLIGVDFEAAAFKPLGWDILDTARVLAKRYPQRADEVVAGLIRGWGRGTERLSPDEFAKVARCFVRATAHKAEGCPKGWTTVR